MIYSPFDQFIVYPEIIINANYVISDALLCFINYAIITLTFCYLCLSLGGKKRINMFFSVFKTMYHLILNIMKSYIGKPYYRRYFPFLFFVFLSLWILNTISLLPFVNCITSHFFFTFALSASIWFSILFLGVSRHGVSYLRLYFPGGIATALMFFLVAIEVMSASFRMVSLALRLIANMIAGHLLLDCLMILVVNLASPMIIFGGSYINFNLTALLLSVIGVAVLTVLFCFELFVCALQAYIFVMLSVIYLVEVL